MAAVAGSKGRITVADGIGRPSFQAILAATVLAGRIGVDQAAYDLLSASRLREVGIDTNMICNLSCSYCYLDDRRESKGKLSARSWASEIAPLIEAGCKLVAFIGKEPLGDTIALETLNLVNSFANRHSFRTGMVTNGTLINRRIDQLCLAQLDYLDVSLDALGQVNDARRGEGVFSTVVTNLKLFLKTDPVNDFSVTSVLHKKSTEHYVEFVDFLFSLGLKTVFGSPILKFTEDDPVKDSAVSVGDIENLIGDLVYYLSDLKTAANGRQVIIDLPYKYSWAFLKRNIVNGSNIRQDDYEAHYWKPAVNLPLFIKFNFFPMSFWRAIRVTHDGHVLENMDLAAHRSYGLQSRSIEDYGHRWYFGAKSQYHHQFMYDFISQHVDLSNSLNSHYDRQVAEQHEHLMRLSRTAYA